MTTPVDVRAPDMPFVLFDVEVAEIEEVTPHLRRVAFTAPDLDQMTCAGRDQRVKLFFPLPGQDRPVVPVGREWFHDYRAIPAEHRPPIRTYTIRRFDRSLRMAWIEFVLHETGDQPCGPASSWIESARPGDRVALLAPNARCAQIGGWEYAPPREADYSLLIGDETALPAIAAILEGLDPDAVAHVVLEVGTRADVPPLHSAAKVEIDVVTRSGAAPGDPAVLLEALRRAELRPGRPYVWLAGESAMVRGVRRHLVGERGIPKGDIYFSGYWKLGSAIE
ncbi:siderophore-interacting protein [Sciscionella sediminilitoris]|uniref:siderophore-interacting protein n=1 Tax=Sciscionella sediminilitoris TaxID=1445613 RepID=UPI000691B4F7|nr:siderophore-interacting protein [Sciscionella sp. SE31]